MHTWGIEPVLNTAQGILINVRNILAVEKRSISDRTRKHWVVEILPIPTAVVAKPHLVEFLKKTLQVLIHAVVTLMSRYKCAISFIHKSSLMKCALNAE